MTPGARIQATIDIIGQILTSWESQKRIPADKLIDNYFKSHRYIGSKDRAAVGELTYWVLRNKASLEWWISRTNGRLSARSYVFAALILRKDYNAQSLESITKDSQYSPLPFDTAESKMIVELVQHGLYHPEMPDHVRLNYPQWMDGLLRESLGKDFESGMKALSEQAPTDLRVNTLKTTREELMENLKAEGFECSPTPLSAVGLRLAKRMPIFTSQYFKQGHFEVQDEGSQLVAAIVDAEPGQRVIDFCAGAGGKTLALAASMNNKGRILAWDNSKKRLDQLTPRMRRAGVDNVQPTLIESESDAAIKRQKNSADRVLVDAPCSGSGTWRRNPDLKWRFTQQDLDEIYALQRSILRSAVRLVKPGGRLIYATCSILKNENERQVEELLNEFKNFRVVCAEKIWDKSNPVSGSHAGSEVSYLWVTPHQTGVDGFFAAILEKTAENPQG